MSKQHTAGSTITRIADLEPPRGSGVAHGGRPSLHSVGNPPGSEEGCPLWVVRGVVIAGERRGRELGFPTANIALGPNGENPPFGIYAALLDGRPAAVSIGVRPTFGEGLAPILEAHVLDENLDLYGKAVTIELWRKLRDEHRFESVDALVEQIQRDIDLTRVICRRLVGAPTAASLGVACHG